MKKILKTILLPALAIMALAACYKDDGNYDYTEIHPIAIEDETAADKIFVQQGKSLKLAPTLDLQGNPEDLSFEWFVYLNSASASYVQDSVLISSDKQLDYMVDPNIFQIGEDYKLTYKVTNNQNGISYFYFYQLSVTDIFTEGWLILEDIQSQGDLSMILEDGEVYNHIYTDRNPDAPVTDPLSLTISAGSISDGVSQDGKKYYIVSENDGIELDGITMKKRFDFEYLFFTPPALKRPTAIGWAGPPGSTTGILINDGKLHTNLVGGFPGAKKFGVQLSSPDNAYDYTMAPQWVSGASWQDTYPIIMYDMENKRFYDVSYDALNAFDEAAIDPSVFDMNDVGLDLIKLDNSNLATIKNAIMKDAAQNAYLLQFKTTRTAADPYITVSKELMNAPSLAEAQDVVCATLSPHIFYGTDQSIYRYEVSSDSYQNAHTFSASEIISLLRYQEDGYGESKPRLVVATWDGQEGKVYYFPINANGSLGALDKTFNGFGKIVDMALKN